MRQAAERGASLSRQLRTFARRQPLHAEPVDIAQPISGMREILDRTLRGDVLVQADLPADIWPIMVDPAELELVILNLCVNARDAMPAGGTITFEARNISNHMENDLAGDFVLLSVADTGIGMESLALARVFEQFLTTKDVGKGSGLGLARVCGFVPPTAGVSEEARTCEQTANSEGAILIVEDSDEVAALVAEMLSELGYRTTRVASAQAALGALANDREIDLVFSDVMMPGS